MAGMRRQVIEGLKVGQVFEVRRTLGAEDTLAFGQLTRDYNPVHYDEAFAQGKGLDGLICHGLLTGSMICQVGGQIAWLASGMEFRFLKPVYLGDTVTCRVEIISIDERGRAQAEATYTNQHGQTVVTAVISGRLPDAGDKARLQAMLLEGDPSNPLSES